MNCTIRVAKTKALISCAVTVQLICVFVFAYAYCWFYHAKAHLNFCLLDMSATTPSTSVFRCPLISVCDRVQLQEFFKRQSSNETFVRLFREHLKHFQDDSHGQVRSSVQVQTLIRGVPVPDVSPLGKQYRRATEVLVLLGSLVQVLFLFVTLVYFYVQ